MGRWGNPCSNIVSTESAVIRTPCRKTSESSTAVGSPYLWKSLGCLRHGLLCVPVGSLGSSWFIWVPLCSSEFIWVPLGPFVFLWVNLSSFGYLWVSLGSFVFLWVPLGFFGFFLCSSGFLCVPLVSSGFLCVPLGFFVFLRVNLSSFGYLWVPLCSFGFLWVSLCSSGFLWDPMGSFGFIWVPLVAVSIQTLKREWPGTQGSLWGIWVQRFWSRGDPAGTFCLVKSVGQVESQYELTVTLQLYQYLLEALTSRIISLFQSRAVHPMQTMHLERLSSFPSASKPVS